MPLLRPSFAVLAAAIAAVASSAAPAHATTFSFPGSGVGAIPESPAPGVPITFNVAGLTKPTHTVSLALQLTHTYAGDLDAVLTSPSGRARMVVFSRPGLMRGTGSSSANFGGDYVFGDAGTGDLWGALAPLGSAQTLPGGSFRATSAGTSRSSNVGCATSLTGVFGGLTPAEANGTWTLTITDRAGGDTGTVGAATLRIDDAPPSLFRHGFEDAALLKADYKLALMPERCTNKIQADFDGDGLTDFVLARPNGSNITWILRYNLGSGTATPEGEAVTFDLGNPGTDFIDTVDYDGDRIADATVWSENTGTFRVRRSSRSIDPVVTIPFGQDGDDPTQSGDYDGDGRDDLALFRAPPITEPDGAMQVIVRRTADGSTYPIFTGLGVDGDAFPTSGFDYDGDGLADVSVQMSDTVTPANARFTYLDGRSGGVIANFVFGMSSDFLVPGNYSGAASYDTLTRRTVSGIRRHSWRESGTGTITSDVAFGITGDSSLGGDYDGDGLSDLAVWRASSTPGASKFIVRSSINTATTWELPGGQAPTVSTSDFAVAGSRVH